MSNSKVCILLDYDGPNPLVSPTRTSRNWKRLSLRNLLKVMNGIAHGSQFRQTAASSHPAVTVQSSVVQATATITPVGVTTGQTVTIGGTALTAQQSRARSVIDPDSVQALDTFTLNGVVFTAVSGAVVPGEATFDCSGSNTACATSIAAQVNAYASPLLSGLVGAFVTSTDEVTFYALAEGTSGNAITLVSSSNSTLPVTGSGFLAGGAAIANNKFDFGVPDNLVGASLNRAINASTTAAVQQVTSTVAASTGVVTLTALAPGVAGNAITLTSSDGATLAVTGSGFLASGSAGAPVRWTF